MKVAALQMVSTPDPQANLATALSLIAQAAAQGAELVALPEYFCLMGHRDADKLAIAEAPGHGPLQDALAQSAREHGVWIVGGTLPIRASQPGRVFNACIVWDPQGQAVARYDKIHLFCFDNGRERYDEAQVLEAGQQPVSFHVTSRAGERFHVGLAICYDLRFPELFRQWQGDQALDAIVLPAAFTHTTGLAHWNLLLRARAVENLCHVLAIGQGGEHPNGRRTFGHSQSIAPWGEVQALLEEGEGVVLGEWSSAELARVRQQLPALQHRKF